MVFSSNIFLFLFLPAICALYFLIPKKSINAKNALLLTASLLFYAWGELIYLGLLLFSIIGNYFFGIWICVNQSRSLRKVGLAVAFNLLLLSYFKYAGFVAENIALLSDFSIGQKFLPHHLPIGISFFSFHAISYLIDIHRKKSKAQRNIFTLALYIAFFPQLVAGPIVRYNFIEKYLTKRRQNFFFVAYGLRRFAIGIGKKVIIANPLGEVADAIFATGISEITAPIAWIGIIAYTLQIYFDFSGYSDMAIGLARIFGFKFPENFNYPYISKSIKEFWRRWHMSLSSWFRDYVYIPLGGNRVSLSRQYFNLILVFFLCGLWHGASWNFVVWGLFHGFFLVIERFKTINNFLNKIPNALQHFYAIFTVMIGWVFFRAADLSSAIDYLKKMFSFDLASVTSIIWRTNEAPSTVIPSEISRLINSNFTLTIFAIALLSFSPIVKNFVLKRIRQSKIYLAFSDFFLILVFIFAAIRLSAATHNPFIYFQF